MSEREVVLDEPVMDEQTDAVKRATERAERAEAELAKLQHSTASTRAGAANGEVGDMAPTPPEEAHARSHPASTGIEALRSDAMMAYLLDSLDAGKDVGHYGRLVFAMVARFFLKSDEVVAELVKDKDFDEAKAIALLRQVDGHDYSPPKRERILEWQAQQEFPILPNADDPDCGNVYRSLTFPQKTYDHIGQYQEEKAEAA